MLNMMFPDKKTTPGYSNHLPLVATQMTSTGVTTIVGATGVPKTVTKQTVILTYQPQQYPVQVGWLTARLAMSQLSMCGVTIYSTLHKLSLVVDRTCSAGIITVIRATGVPKTVTKQPQQYLVRVGYSIAELFWIPNRLRSLHLF